jgi:hypothetical protein
MKKQKGWDEVICFESINIKIIFYNTKGWTCNPNWGFVTLLDDVIYDVIILLSSNSSLTLFFHCCLTRVYCYFLLTSSLSTIYPSCMSYNWASNSTNQKVPPSLTIILFLFLFFSLYLVLLLTLSFSLSLSLSLSRCFRLSLPSPSHPSPPQL